MYNCLMFLFLFLGLFWVDNERYTDLIWMLKKQDNVIIRSDEFKIDVIEGVHIFVKNVRGYCNI